MESPKRGILVLMLAVVAVVAVAGGFIGWQIKHAPSAPMGAGGNQNDHLRATYDPIHFKPAIDQATDAQCLACHKEVLEDKVRPSSPAGIKAANSKAWYQQVSTYTGEQDTFHRRHLLSPMAKELMNLNCTTCHQGNDPREEAPGSSASAMPQSTDAFTLRKNVNTEAVCLKCHGQMDTEIMGLPSPWHESKEIFANSCLTCHAAIRTTRHQVNYLKAAAIEAAGEKDSETCYGCHGGRSWYRIAYPYPRHAWEGMAPEVPEWARNRPTESEARFRVSAVNTK